MNKKSEDNSISKDNANIRNDLDPMYPKLVSNPSKDSKNFPPEIDVTPEDKPELPGDTLRYLTSDKQGSYMIKRDEGSYVVEHISSGSFESFQSVEDTLAFLTEDLNVDPVESRKALESVLLNKGTFFVKAPSKDISITNSKKALKVTTVPPTKPKEVQHKKKPKIKQPASESDIAMKATAFEYPVEHTNQEDLVSNLALKFKCTIAHVKENVGYILEQKYSSKRKKAYADENAGDPIRQKELEELDSYDEQSKELKEEIPAKESLERFSKKSFNKHGIKFVRSTSNFLKDLGFKQVAEIPHFNVDENFSQLQDSVASYLSRYPFVGWVTDKVSSGNFLARVFARGPKTEKEEQGENIEVVEPKPKQYNLYPDEEME